MLKTYYMLTKPGIIMGNLITTIAGCALAAEASFSFGIFVTMLIGLGMVIAAACVCNNYIDRVSDQKMSRTKERPLAKGLISGKRAIVFSVILGLTGSVILLAFVNLLAWLVASLGFVIYVALYSLCKHHTTYATLIGSISGAMPPVVGYVAIANRIDLPAILLFSILVLWQMPHFYAIAMYRLEDYRRANIPVLPLQKGVQITKVHMLGYILAFFVALLLLPFLGYTGHLYLVIAGLLGVVWLLLSIRGFRVADNIRWARQMFAVSLFVIMGFSAALSFPLLKLF